jgi:hypothetical protein
VVGPESTKFRRHAKKVRNSVAFHLDDRDWFTSETLGAMKLSNFTIACGDSNHPFHFYLVLPDYIDLQYLTSKLIQGNQLQETADEVIAGLMSYAVDLMQAAYPFQMSLLNKSLKGHLY